jgi:hypothetical protein
MEPPSVMCLPLSCFENMQMELAWRFDDLIERIWDIQDDLTSLKDWLNPKDFSSLPNNFDPLQTFGKY